MVVWTVWFWPICLRAGYRVCLVHCNFMLRNQESEQDAQLVRDFAAQHHLPVYIKRFYTQQYAQYSGLNTQLAARTLRYNWFEELVLRKVLPMWLQPIIWTTTWRHL